MTPSARLQAAIDLLGAIHADPRPADAVANAFFRARRYIGSTDRRAISERVWAVLRAHRRLEWWLCRSGGNPEARLLTGALALLDGDDPATLVAAFSGGRFAPALLSASESAVLRRLVGHTLNHPAMPVPVRFEFPNWLLPSLARRFGSALPAEMAALLEPAPLDLRVNLLKATRAEAQSALAAEGIQTTPTPLSPWGLRVTERKHVTSGSAFQSGLVEIQDEGSQLIALLTDARPGARVADLCAGAGGKTLALAMTMENRGHILAGDVSGPRLEAATRRLRRAGVHNVERHLLSGPGDKTLKRRVGGFDRVLVDAPCTGIGTWRRNPDARQRLHQADLDELLPKQEALLDSAARLVRIGGKLIYATCSLLVEENEAQVTAFLDRHSGFAVVPLARAWPDGNPPMTGQFLATSPAREGTDGFFAAVLERVR